MVKCSVVKEYLESGRAEDVDQSIRGSCSIAEVSAVQRELQQCSHNISLNLFYDIQRLEEGFMESIVHDDQNKTKVEKRGVKIIGHFCVKTKNQAMNIPDHLFLVN